MIGRKDSSHDKEKQADVIIDTEQERKEREKYDIYYGRVLKLFCTSLEVNYDTAGGIKQSKDPPLCV